jgi:hypothetical protein
MFQHFSKDGVGGQIEKSATDVGHEQAEPKR